MSVFFVPRSVPVQMDTRMDTRMDMAVDNNNARNVQIVDYMDIDYDASLA